MNNAAVKATEIALGRHRHHHGMFTVQLVMTGASGACRNTFRFLFKKMTD